MARNKSQRKKDDLVIKTRELNEIQENCVELQANYIDELDTNPKYALTVDPENKYNMPESQKKFIEYYVNFKNVNTAAELCGIDMNIAKQYFIAYTSQLEIRRINMALYHRQFASRLLSLDEIGGYLTSLLTGANVSIADQPTTINDRLAIVKLLIDLNKMKIEGMQNPSMILAQDIDVQIKNLSLATVKQLIAQDAKDQKYIDDPNLTVEESAYLSTLPTTELLQLLDDTNKEKINENK